MALLSAPVCMTDGTRRHPGYPNPYVGVVYNDRGYNMTMTWRAESSSRENDPALTAVGLRVPG